MASYLQYDEDEHRLPEGMKRVGYDADTQQYTYRDADGSFWEGAPGAKYGTLRRKGGYDDPDSILNRTPFIDDEDDTVFDRVAGTLPQWQEPQRSPKSPESQNKEAWRLFGPFLVLIGLVLLLFWHMLRGGNPASIPKSPIPPAAAAAANNCGNTLGEITYIPYEVKKGDWCWGIATGVNISLDELKKVNDGLNCEALEVGTQVCIPGE